MIIRIICDFDGTITREDVTDILLERFALPEWREIEAAWKAGRIGSRECMLRQVDLLRADIRDIDRCLDAIDIDPGFPAFAALARRHGVDLRVVSDGIDYAIHRILGRRGLAGLPVFANHLEILEERRYRLGFPHASDGCAKGSGTCKCRIARHGASEAIRLLIGDGASDYCAASSVHLAFAKDKLLTHCRDGNLPHVAFADFDEAARLLRDMISRRERPSFFPLESITE